MSKDWPPIERVAERAEQRRQSSLLEWAGACAAMLDVSRRTWRGLRDRMPPGYGRRSFVVPAIAITGAFLAGAWWLRTRAHRDVHDDPNVH